MSMKMDGVSFISPKPGTYRSVFTLIHPLTYEVWIACLASYLMTVMAMKWVSSVEETTMDVELRVWSSWTRAAWYAFGTLVGESITRDTKSSGANSLRYQWSTQVPLRGPFHSCERLNSRVILSVWILYAFLLTAGYGGSLRAFFLRPEYRDPIDTMEDIVESGLPWKIVLYGVELDNYLETSQDPVVRKFWEGKTVIPYDEFPFEHVGAQPRTHS